MKSIIDLIFEVIVWVGMAIIITTCICVLIQRAIKKKHRIKINNKNRNKENSLAGETSKWNHGCYEGLIEDEEGD